MSVLGSVLIVVAVTSAAVAVMLLVRRRAPEGSVFEDGDRASGVFGVLATGFSVLLGLIVFLAFSSYDQSRAGAETEALLLAQQYETAQFMPVRVRATLAADLVCYGRAVVRQEWPKMRAGTEGNSFNQWSVAMFRTLQTIQPKTASEQSAYDRWLDQRANREQARNDRIHGAVGVIPNSLWIVLFFIAGTIFAYMLFFADSAERWFAQAMLMGSVVAVITGTMLLIHFLDSPVRPHGGLQPVAMKRTLGLLARERRVAGTSTPLPCDSGGAAV